MKKLIALFLATSMLLTGCAETKEHISSFEEESSGVVSESHEDTEKELIYEQNEIDVNQFDGLDDVDLLQYVEDNIYAELVDKLNSDDFIVENVTTSYISQEYIDEVVFNSQSNIFFGYTLEEVNKSFSGKKYVFSLGENGNTIVQKMQIVEDNTTEEIIKNVAIGAGVILVCVAVSYFTAGAAVPTAVNLIFTAAAKTGASFALSSGALGGISAGIVRGIETGDMNEALEAAALAGSESFKWGAITGAVTGGASKALSIVRSTKVTHTPRQSEITVVKKTENAVEQVSYLNGKEVNYFTPGSTRPDVVVKNLDGTIKAIEVKNYNLASSNSRSNLIRELKRQVSERIKNLPKGSQQEIVLDARGRGYSTKLLENVVKDISESLDDIYPNIPIEVMRY